MNNATGPIPNDATTIENNNRYVDLRCIVVNRKALKWTLVALVVVAILVTIVAVILSKSLLNHKSQPPPLDQETVSQKPQSDQYSEALHKALLFFNAQKSGKLSKDNGIEWRGDSGLNDGADVIEDLVGGYYNAGDNTKFHFPMAFSMTMLSWSVIEYKHKYKSINEYDHVLELIKWGTDYLLRTFNSSYSTIAHIYGQVGGSQNGSTIPDDHNCWQRPEDIDYNRSTQIIKSGADLAGEMTAALAAASIVFKDDVTYSKKLVQGATTLWAFAIDKDKRDTYSKNNPFIDAYYNSTGFYDEYIWGSAWMYFATGNMSYLSFATKLEVVNKAKVLGGNFDPIQKKWVLSWDNKLPAAMLLLTRLRLFLNPGYPYSEMLRSYRNATNVAMCSYLRQYQIFNWTQGGLILLSQGWDQNLQYVVNAVFLASLYADYANTAQIPGWYCCSAFIPFDNLREFATSQMDYIMGKNPMNMSYVVGYGNKYPEHVHHQGASIPNNKIKYSCKGGLQWLSSDEPNPNIIIGAMVGGPDQFDKFLDARSNYSYTEPTLVANAGLVAALVSLTATGSNSIDVKSITAAVPPQLS